MSGTIANITLIGRLARDAEFKYTNTQMAIASFTVVTDARVKKGDQWIDEPSYWDVSLFGKQAESVNQYLTKGKLVSVVGAIRVETWEKDGIKHSKAKVNADNLVLLGSKPADGASAAPRTGQGQTPAAGQDFSDDIPF